MQRFEYKVISGLADEAQFNQLGQDGWELVSSYTTNRGIYISTRGLGNISDVSGGGGHTDSIIHIFKRPRP